MKHRTWPYRSTGSRFSTFPVAKSKPIKRPNTFPDIAVAESDADDRRDFAALPDDVLMKIAATFSHPNLTAASLVCKSWNEALRPLREAMLFLRSGKRFKHGRGDSDYE